ncbi:response regulator [Bacillus sp. ISL-40]|uniref:response regulator n=1 Tax=unclassified Bacillus (in: firmicutes) TaxID=185979 RepID=UPI001BE8B7B7|nr:MULTISPECIES: response regulator [unclassified Bacillus (in: firmicutes)]MBT2696560.1 response regulator [Bacillus sp. ISL-40]MBT2740761.1 response regulator [Bacillus sp. ISL-77]
MYRVLIVDDEPIISNGIHALINWEMEGMSAEQGCANGKEALDAMAIHPFDILITDIKMPLLNGIDLIKQALPLYPSLKVILISNYSDFEYVKEGLKLGAVDYLLKLTLLRDDLLAVLRRCISMLEEEQKKDTELIQYQEAALYRKQKSVEQEIKRLIAQEKTPPSSADWAPVWIEQSYVCAYLMLDGAEGWIENHGYLYVQMLMEDLQGSFYLKQKEGSALLVSEDSMFLLFPDYDGEAKHWLLQWKRYLELEWGISTSIGFTVEQGIQSILNGYFDSRTACQKRFFNGVGGIYRMNEPENSHSNGMSLMDGKVKSDWTPFYEMLHNGDPVSIAVEFAYKRWNYGGHPPEKVKEEAYSLLSGSYKLYEGEGPLLVEQLNQLQRAETLEQLVFILKCQLEEIVKPVVLKVENNGYGGQMITKALEYIENHYKENLTLQSVADFVHLNKSYFSLLFKKQTGRNFIDYIIELRIREAKRLLAQYDCHIYEVAEAAGFKDVKYFSKMFKKMTGFTPVKYREEHQTADS